MNKTKFIFSFLLVISVFTFFIFTGINPSVTKPPSESSALYGGPPPAGGNISDSFLIAAMDDGKDYNFTYLYDSLGLNLWHWYCGWTTDSNNWHYPDGWMFCAPNDHLLSNISEYGVDIHNKLIEIGSHHMKAFIHRPKIEYLCYGQRSDYRCVDTSKLEDKYLWFYTFRSPDHIGNDIQDDPPYGDGRYVRFCNASAQGPGHDAPGLVVYKLRINNEQCNRSTGFDGYRGDTEHEWYIKPRIRIDSGFANNPLNWGKLVCRVDVYNQDGYDTNAPQINKIKSFDIRVRNFKASGNSKYDGNYREEFTFIDSINNMWFDTSTQSRRGDWGNKWAWTSRGDRTPGQEDNKADIQVYWYGNCDMWIDYVRVDNDIAHNLFGTGQTHDMYLEWLQWEAQDIACNAGNVPVKFYLELTEFNNIPAMAYVNHKLDLLCGKHVDLIADQLTFYQYHMSWYDRGKIAKADQIVKEYVHPIGMTQTYPGCYAFTSIEGTDSTYSRIPNTLPRFQGNDVLAKAIAPADYDAWLQMQLDTTAFFFEGQGGSYSPLAPCDQMPQYAGMYQWVWKLANGISKQADIPIIADVQAHQWMIHCSEVDREPTNEELDLTCNLPVSYGAKGMVLEIYAGWQDSYGNYCYGFTNADGQTPRYTNVYGQPKWDKLKSIIKRLKKWGLTLMSFDNTQTNSYIYRLTPERNSLKAKSYFENVLTYRYGQGTLPDCSDNPPPISGLIRECEEDRYVQVAIFKQNSLIAEPYASFFMIINRRCSPYRPEIGEQGGRRYIALNFYQNRPEFAAGNSWDIIDLGDSTAAHIQFDKRAPGAIALGEFKPGEGKLYKIVPTAQIGGNLFCDENITDQDLTCLDTVYNNGHNITIGSGTTIHFTDSSKFIINGGTFQLGDPNYNGPCNISIGAASGNHWTGFDFNNCTIKIYNTAFSGITNDTNYAINIIDCPFVDIQKNTFNCSDNFTGAVNLTYYSISSIDNAYIGGNTISLNSSAIPAFNILSYAGITIPLIAENNTFTSSSALGSTAIMLSGITGGAIKNNTITNYEKSINALSSSLDISGNSITSNVSSSKGISGLAGTELKMNNSGDLYLGGMNTIFNTSESSFNLFVENSYFLLDNGENIFDIKGDAPSYHLYGSFPESDEISTYATFNCFKVNNTPAPPPVKDSNNMPIFFTL